MGFACNLTLSHFLGRTSKKNHPVQCLIRLHCVLCFQFTLLPPLTQLTQITLLKLLKQWLACFYILLYDWRAIHGKKAIRGKRGMGGWLVRLLEHLSLLLYDCQSHSSTMTLLEVLHSSQTVNIVTKSLSLWLSMSMSMSPSLSFFWSCIFIGPQSDHWQCLSLTP